MPRTHQLVYLAPSTHPSPHPSPPLSSPHLPFLNSIPTFSSLTIPTSHLPHLSLPTSHLPHLSLPTSSLIPSPSPQLLSLAVRIMLRRPGENYHVMYATVYVTHMPYCSLVPVNRTASDDSCGGGLEMRLPHPPSPLSYPSSHSLPTEPTSHPPSPNFLSQIPPPTFTEPSDKAPPQNYAHVYPPLTKARKQHNVLLCKFYSF